VFPAGGHPEQQQQQQQNSLKAPENKRHYHRVSRKQTFSEAVKILPV